MLTRNDAVKAAIQVWETIAKEGKPKSNYPELNVYAHRCPLCEYARVQGGVDRLDFGVGTSACRNNCPFYLHFGFTCTDCKSEFVSYFDGMDYSRLKSLATKFLKQLKEIPIKEEPMAAKAKLTATFEDVDEQECYFYDSEPFFCMGDVTEKVTLNGVTINVCEECASKLERIFEAFSIQIKTV